MAAVAAETDFIDEYVGAVSVELWWPNDPDMILFPGQMIQNGNFHPDILFRIIDIDKNNDTVSLLEFDRKLVKDSFSEFFKKDDKRYDNIPVKNPTSMKPSTNTNKHEDDLMLAYSPDRAAEIMQNYVIRGYVKETETCEILGIFRSYSNKLHYLIQYEGAPTLISEDEYLLEIGESSFELVRRDNADADETIAPVRSGTVSSNASSGTSASRGDGGTAHVDVDRRFENIESRLERIERRLGSENPEDDETGVPNSLPSLRIRF